MAIKINWGEVMKTAVPAAAVGAGGYLAYKGAKNAAATQAQSAEQALALEREMFNKGEANRAPWLAGGRASLASLMRGLGLQPYGGSWNNGGGGGAPGQSPFSSPLLGNENANAPSAMKRFLSGGLTGATTGATLGSIVPGIGTAIGAGVGGAVGTIGSLFGRGRHEANSLVDLQNNVAGEVDRITKAVNQAKQSGTLTKENLQEALNTVKALQGQFGEQASKFSRAGPGGVNTLAQYFDPMTAQWEKDLPGLQSGPATSQGGDNGPSDISEGYFNKPFTNEDFIHDPGYEARLAQGSKALNAYYAAHGMSNSSGAAKSLGKYGQTFASNEFGAAFERNRQERTDRFNRLASIAGLGQQANVEGSAAGTNFGNNAAGLITDIGATRAAGQAGGYNAIANAFGQGANIFQQGMTMRDLQVNSPWYQSYLAQNRKGAVNDYLNPEGGPS